MVGIPAPHRPGNVLHTPKAVSTSIDTIQPEASSDPPSPEASVLPGPGTSRHVADVLNAFALWTRLVRVLQGYDRFAA